MTKLCFIDMDGVLADFVTDCTKLHNFQPHNGDWFDMLPHQWAAMGYDFWRNLPKLSHANELIGKLESIFGIDNMFICTAPIQTAGCLQAKADWIQHHYPELRRSMIIAKSKHAFAGPNKYLIDDSVKNCTKFFNSDGKFYLFPATQNYRHHELPISSRVYREIEEWSKT